MEGGTLESSTFLEGVSLGGITAALGELIVSTFGNELGRGAKLVII